MSNLKDNTTSTPSKVSCEANVLKADTLAPSAFTPVPDPGTYKLPVVVSEFDVFINLESVIHLNTPAFEIKRIDKEVFLNEARFVPTVRNEDGTVTAGIIFLKGYLRKNIEYASRTCKIVPGSASIGGVINDTTVQIPFLTSTTAPINISPIIIPSPANETTRYFDKHALGKNLKESDRRTLEYLNEPIFAEIVLTEVIDADINEFGYPLAHVANEEEFTKFTDKAVIRIRIKLLQKQQVTIPTQTESC